MTSRQGLSEFLDNPAEVNALIEAGPNWRTRLFTLEQWRAGVRISRAIGLRGRDLYLEVETPVLRVRCGKGDRGQLIEMHPELRDAFASHRNFGLTPERGQLVDTTRPPSGSAQKYRADASDTGRAWTTLSARSSWPGAPRRSSRDMSSSSTSA